MSSASCPWYVKLVHASAEANVDLAVLPEGRRMNEI